MPGTQLMHLYPVLGKDFSLSCPYRSVVFGGGVDTPSRKTICHVKFSPDFSDLKNKLEHFFPQAPLPKRCKSDREPRRHLSITLHDSVPHAGFVT